MMEGHRYSLNARRAAARWLLGCLLLPRVAGASGQGGAPVAVRAEVEALLAALETSGCRFQRNGSWHSAVEARAHLTRKWRELDRRQLATSTEGFIQQAASSSLISGKTYLVQCGTAPALPSREWLMTTLRSLRAAKL